MVFFLSYKVERNWTILLCCCFLLSFLKGVGASHKAEQCLYVVNGLSHKNNIMAFDQKGKLLAEADSTPSIISIAQDETQEYFYLLTSETIDRLNVDSMEREMIFNYSSIASRFCIFPRLRSCASLIVQDSSKLFLSYSDMIVEIHLLPNKSATYISYSYSYLGLGSDFSFERVALNDNYLFALDSDTNRVYRINTSNMTQAELLIEEPQPHYEVSYFSAIDFNSEGDIYLSYSEPRLHDDTLIIAANYFKNGTLNKKFNASYPDVALEDINVLNILLGRNQSILYVAIDFMVEWLEIGYQIVIFDTTYNTESGIMLRFISRDLTLPLNMMWHKCPRQKDKGNSDLSKYLLPIVIVPTAIGSLILILVSSLCVSAMLISKRKGRRYYDTDAVLSDMEDMAASDKTMQFTFQEVNYKDLKMGRMLGVGSSGRVFKAEYRAASVAVKIFDGVRVDEAEPGLLLELRQEAQIMQKLSHHPHVINFVGAVTEGQGIPFALVLEYCPRGSLFTLLIEKQKKMPLLTLVRVARDISRGVLHLHKENVIHRDLATRNILVGRNYEMFVSDFGLARVKQQSACATTKQDFGPIAWMAPEALVNREYSEATDAFSFGVLLWEIMARKVPWRGLDPAQIVTSVTSNIRLKIPRDCDPTFQQIIKKCWEHKPAHRPSFEKIEKQLSDYYKALKKIHGKPTISISADEESSDEDEDQDLSDGAAQAKKFESIKKKLTGFIFDLSVHTRCEVDLVYSAARQAIHEWQLKKQEEEEEEDKKTTEERMPCSSQRKRQIQFFSFKEVPLPKEASNHRRQFVRTKRKTKNVRIKDVTDEDDDDDNNNSNNSNINNHNHQMEGNGYGYGGDDGDADDSGDDDDGTNTAEVYFSIILPEYNDNNKNINNKPISTTTTTHYATDSSSSSSETQFYCTTTTTTNK